MDGNFLIIGTTAAGRPGPKKNGEVKGMAKQNAGHGQNQGQGQGQLIPPPAGKPEKEKKLKIAPLNKFTVEDADVLKRGLQNMRDLTNNIIGVSFRILDAHRRYHYLPGEGRGPARTNDQDKRIQERAAADWETAVPSTLSIIRHMEEEIRAIKASLEG